MPRSEAMSRNKAMPRSLHPMSLRPGAKSQTKKPFGGEVPRGGVVVTL